MKALDRQHKDKYTLWRRLHDLAKWSGIIRAIRDLEGHEHPQDDNWKKDGKDHVCQVFANVNQALPLYAYTLLNWNGEDRVDPDYYIHDAAVTPQQVTVRQAGWYRITLGHNNMRGHESRVLINGVVNQRAPMWEHQEDRYCQVYMVKDTIIAGLFVLSYVGEDRVDANYFTHDPVLTPWQVTVNCNGWYKITTGTNNTTGHRTRVRVNGVVNNRSVAWDQ